MMPVRQAVSPRVCRAGSMQNRVGNRCGRPALGARQPAPRARRCTVRRPPPGPASTRSAAPRGPCCVSAEADPPFPALPPGAAAAPL